MSDDWKFDIAEKASETDTVDWDALLKMLPVLKDMEKIEQNPEFHGEGNVFNHTKLAVERLVEDTVWKGMESWRKGALFLAVLLHDIGKIDRTIEEDGVFSSKGHSAAGSRMIRQLLWDYKAMGGYKVPYAIREYVANMSLLHMLPIYLLEKEDPLYAVCASSQTVCNRDLGMLSQADSSGRICSNWEQSWSAIEIFNDFCVDNDCYWDQKSFASDHTRFLYFLDRVGHPSLERYHDKKGTVHMMSGLPGAGKDTYIKKNLSGLPTVGLDDIRDALDVKVGENEGGVQQAAKEQCREYMRKGQDFVLNATNLLRQTRNRWITLFHQYGYRIEIHYLEPSYTILMKQNANRTKKVPEVVVSRMFERLESPTVLECHKLHLSVS